MTSLRQRICIELNERNIKCSPQAINALWYAASLSSPDIVGCSDSLLMGLLRCGSYTIEALISSGIDARCLTEAARNSVYYLSDDNSDPIQMLFASHGVFGTYIDSLEAELKYIETSDLLEIAISPESLDGSFPGWFPKHLKSSKNITSEFIEHLENQVCYLIDACTEIISRKVEKTLETRRKALTIFEKNMITEELSLYDVSQNDANWAIELTNSWFIEKKLDLNNSEITLSVIKNLFQNIRYGASIFIENGGDFKILNASLSVARKFAPERDQPILGLIERDGKVYIKQFSYNSSISIQNENAGIISIGTEMLIPLTTYSVISEFEELINSRNVNENTIQKFLERYPEILESLGYATCRPHIILNQPGQKDLIPDFILQRPGNNGFDILDLKLPTAQVAVSKPYLRISHEISKALAQLRAYRNYFKFENNRNKFYKKYGLEPLTPELIVVIGRNTPDIDFADRIEINKQVQGMRILTYDELFEFGKTRAINYQNMANQALNRTC